LEVITKLSIFKPNGTRPFGAFSVMIWSLRLNALTVWALDSISIGASEVPIGYSVTVQGIVCDPMPEARADVAGETLIDTIDTGSDQVVSCCIFAFCTRPLPLVQM
jgi:hypothetical protein